MHLHAVHPFNNACSMPVTAQELSKLMADNCVQCGTLAKHRPVNSDKYAAVLFVLIQECENRLQGCPENDHFMF